MNDPKYHVQQCACAGCVSMQNKAGAQFADNPGGPFATPGAKVMAVTPGGAFSRAFIEVGDVVVSINHVGVFSAREAYLAVNNAPTGVPVPIGLIDSRTGQHTTLWATF